MRGVCSRLVYLDSDRRCPSLLSADRRVGVSVATVRDPETLTSDSFNEYLLSMLITEHLV